MKAFPLLLLPLMLWVLWLTFLVLVERKPVELSSETIGVSERDPGLNPLQPDDSTWVVAETPMGTTCSKNKGFRDETSDASK